MAADQASAGGLEVRAASLVGPGHRCMEPALPRQDAYRLGQDRQRRYLIAAVADGMSDSQHSEVGANTAVAAVVGRLRESLDAGAGLTELDADEIFLATAGQMSGVAHQRGWPDDDVRTVLAAAVIPAQPGPTGVRQAWLAGIADVSIWRWLPGGWEPLMGDVKDGMDGSRLEHYLPYHPQHVVSRVVELGPGEIIAITTDGIADAFATLPGAAAWFADRWREPRQLASFILDIGYEESQFNDDRTAVVAWCVDVRADP
jgi:serine/threonine protein phosphatase PrpC